jgi:NADPH-dependent 2,4-dienoyl-CoA reductase/sulfur reductase-like enzyme
MRLGQECNDMGMRDLVIIGGGAGGLVVASVAAQLGL